MNTPFFGRTSVKLKAADEQPPHLFAGPTARVRQWQKTFSLLPLVLSALWGHGWAACHVLGISLCGALLAEAAGSVFSRAKPSYHDGETIFYGFILGLVLPFSIPTEIIFMTAFAAVFLGRELFGGFGQAPFFPPALGLLFLYLGAPFFIQAFDFKQAQSLANALPFAEAGTRTRMLIFYQGGACLEDVSWLAILLGGLYLCGKRVIRLEGPALYLVVFFSVEFFLKSNPLTSFISGGLLLTAFYGLEHSAGLPLSRFARLIFAASAALISALMPARDMTTRALAGILALNALSPWLDALFRPGGTRALSKNTVYGNA